MKKIFKNIITILLALILITSNMGNSAYLFAQENKIKATTTDFKPDKVMDLQVRTRSSTCIKLEWNQVECANGYRIYRSTIKNGIYRRIDEVCGKTTCYIDRDLDCGTNYYYKVRAFRKMDDKICLGCPSDILDTTTCPDVVKNLEAKCVSNCSVELSWQTVYKSSGYEVYRSTREKGNYKKIAIFTDKGKTYYRDNDVKSGKNITIRLELLRN